MDRELRILIIEDSSADAELEEYALRKSGLVFTSKIVDTEETFRKATDEFFPDIILSDYDLPTFDGLAALRIAKEKCPDVPFILVTGKIGEEFAIDKIKEGATDYVLKGNLKRLVPSVIRALQEAKEVKERKQAEENLQIHRIELEMQNDELHKAASELEASRTRYSDLYDLAPVGYFSFDKDGLILEANLTAAKELGIERSLLVNKPFRFYVVREDRDILDSHIRNVFKIAARQTCEIRLKKKDGIEFYVQLESIVSNDLKGNSLCRSSIIEITERKQVEEALRKSEAELRIILDNTPFPIAIVDVQDNIINFWSRSAITLFGHTAPTSPEWYQIAYPDPDYRREVINRWRPFVEQARISGQAVNAGEYRVSCRDGSVRICELYPYFCEDKLIVTFNDITERKQAEDSLRISEERYRSLVENQTELICRFNPDGTFIFVNDVYCEFFGKTKDELIGKKWFPIPVDEDLTFINERLKTISPTNPVVIIENRVVSVKGDIHWIQFINKGFFDLNGNLLEIQSVGRDITESKRSMEKLEESQERFRKVFEEGPLGMVIVNPSEGRFIRANDVFCQSLGYTEEELKQLTFLDVTHPEHRGADMEAINKLKEGKIPKYVTEKRYLKKNGEMFWGTVTASIVRHDDGQPLYLLAMIEDITKRKKSELG